MFATGSVPHLRPSLCGKQSAPAVDKSFLLYILPAMEQSNLYNAINQNLTIFGLENTTNHSVLWNAEWDILIH
jgi:hypothetical protein